MSITSTHSCHVIARKSKIKFPRFYIVPIHIAYFYNNPPLAGKTYGIYDTLNSSIFLKNYDIHIILEGMLIQYYSRCLSRSFFAIDEYSRGYTIYRASNLELTLIDQKLHYLAIHDDASCRILISLALKSRSYGIHRTRLIASVDSVGNR